MILQNLIGDPTDIQTIDFEDLTAGNTTYTATTANPFVLEAGLYFSVGKSQSTPQNNPLLQVQAHFAGNNAYLPADSTPQSYITLASTSALGAAGEATPIAYSGQVYSTVTCTADVDADGICDSWETPSTTSGTLPTGCPLNHDCIPITTSTGTHLFYDLCFIDAFSNVWSPTSPANTLVCPTKGHKDIFVQLSWMQGHQPDPNAIKLVIKAFGNGPVSDTVAPNGLPGYPNGLKGVALHVVVANGNGNPTSTTPYATPNQATFNVWQDDCSRFTNCNDGNNNNDFRHVKLNNFGTYAEVHGTGSQWSSGCTATPTAGAIQCPRDAKAQAYHYGLFIRTFGGPSGVSELPGNDFIVSLGTGFGNLPGTTGDGFGGTTGTIDEQAGTFMHELGHNLDLDHGGPHKFLTSTGSLAGVPSSADVVVNCKASYISVMGYTRQLPAASFIGSGTPWETQGLDYSRITPNTVQSSLNEAALSEPAGVPYPKANTVIWGTSSTSIHTHATGANIDWNQIGGVSGTVSVDANNVGITNCPLPTASSLQTYNSYDDWDNLQYNFRTGTSYLDGVYPALNRVPEQTGQMYQTLKNNFFNGEGFTLLQPVVKAGKCGSCNAGSSIPIKFTLKDANGKLITTAKVTFTAQQINPTTGAPIGNLIVGPIPSFAVDSTGQYQYNWKTPTAPGTYVVDLYLNYNLATQQLLVGSGQNGITIQLTLS
jgi:hypothetical protein